MDKWMFRVSEACDLLGISRSKGYELIKSRQLPAVKVGDSWRVPAEALRSWINDKVAETEASGER